MNETTHISYYVLDIEDKERPDSNMIVRLTEKNKLAHISIEYGVTGELLLEIEDARCLINVLRCAIYKYEGLG